jgi:hypothetical protein
MIRLRELAKPLAARDTTKVPLMPQFYKDYHTTAGTVSRVRATLEYRNAMAACAKRQNRILGEEFKDLTLQIKGKLRDYSNKAVEVLHDIMMDPDAKEASRVSACTELLDRDGRFAKVSRLMNVKEGQDGAPMLPEDAATEMLEALAAAKKDRVN